MQLTHSARSSGKCRTAGKDSGRIPMGRRIKRINSKSALQQRSDQGKELSSLSGPTMHQQNPPVTSSPTVNRDVFPLVFSPWSDQNPAHLRLSQNCCFPFQVPHCRRRTQEFLKGFSCIH